MILKEKDTGRVIRQVTKLVGVTVKEQVNQIETATNVLPSRDYQHRDTTAMLFQRQVL